MAYICIGAFFFTSLDENWTYLDGAYFCFITLSTIGFGDLNPAKSLQSLSNRPNDNGHLELIACCTYLIVGLIVIAMAVSLIQDEILIKCRKTATTFGIVKQINR